MFNLERLGGAVIVHVDDDLDLATRSKLVTALAEAETTDAERIIISLLTCKYCSSMCLRILEQAEARLAGRLTIVVRRGSMCAKLLEISGLDRKSYVTWTIDEAMRRPIGI